MAIFEFYGETDQNFPKLKKLRQLFAQMTETEKVFFNHIRFLYTVGLGVSDSKHDETGSHVFFGAHVVVGDNGARYTTWSAAVDAGDLKGGTRTSSHYKNVQVQQYEIILSGLGCILFGKTSAGHTWFQNESWPATESGMKGFGKMIAHGVLGYGAHKLSGNMQVGALGYSEWSEKKHQEVTVEARRLS